MLRYMLKSDKEGFMALFFIPFMIFLVSVSFFPMTIDSDNGLLIKSAQQYHLGQVDSSPA